jgi:hypothetical protein
MPASALRVIPFKKDIINAKRLRVNALRYLVEFQAEAQREFSADYEKVPASSRYRRTGNLGRGWRVPGAVTYGADFTLTLRNPVLYASYVQGRKEDQARVMKRKGWSSSTDVAKRVQTKLNRRYRVKLFTG